MFDSEHKFGNIFMVISYIEKETLTKEEAKNLKNMQTTSVQKGLRCCQKNIFFEACVWKNCFRFFLHDLGMFF